MPSPTSAGNARGYIVNVGSISSFVGQASTPAYTTSKHAVLGLTRSIALDYAADGIRCNCVCPGITDTPMLREHLDATADPEATLADRLRRVPMGVALTPVDVARSILFFSCEDSSGVTGTSLTIDCGYLAAAEWETQGQTAFYGAAMQFKLACADFTFPLLPHDDALDLIAAARFRRSRPRPVRGPVAFAAVAENFATWPSAAGRMRNKLADRGLKAADVLFANRAGLRLARAQPPRCPAAPQGPRSVSERTLDYAAACGAKHVSALPGVRFEEEPLAASLGRAADELAWRCEQAASPALGLLASRRTSARSRRVRPQALRLLERVPGLTLTLDYTHFTRAGIPDSAVEPLIKHASHFHARGRARAGCKRRSKTT